MKLYFYSGPNFGDDLNTWLLPKVFPNFFDEDTSRLFLGIGSTLYDSHPKSAEKIVFGAGFAKYSPPPVIDSTWKIYCVRGPKTAEALGLSPTLVAGDSAILINKFRSTERVLSHKFSFIPHWGSAKYGNWAQLARDVGLNFIDPRWPVERVLTQIESSEVIIAEAMHGAIVADALRVPWIPLRPIEPQNRFKWSDWAGALDIKLQVQPLASSGINEKLIAIKGLHGSRWERAGIRLIAAHRLLDIPFKALARESLRKAMLTEPTLSSDSALDCALDRLETAASNIRRDYP